jgi:two-component system sensor histidine kinase KdpD
MQRRRDQLLSLSLTSDSPPLWLGILASLAAVALCTLLVYPLKSIAPVVSLGVVYLPAVLVVSTVWGLRLGLLTSVASTLALNFFHIPPLHRLAIADEDNWVALAAFAIAAVLSSAVAGFARSRAIEVQEGREEADRALAELTALTRERDRMQAEAMPMLEAIEQRAAGQGVPVDSRIERGRSYRHAWSGCSTARALTASSFRRPARPAPASPVTISSGCWQRRRPRC